MSGASVGVTFIHIAFEDMVLLPAVGEYLEPFGSIP